MKPVKMRATVDRIEDGRTAVFVIEGGGQLLLPARLFPGLREGQSFDVSWTENPAREKRLRAEVSRLQAALLRRKKS